MVVSKVVECLIVKSKPAAEKKAWGIAIFAKILRNAKNSVTKKQLTR
jgi:hypothetical protein